MGMKVVTKLDLGHDFDSHIQSKIDSLTLCHRTKKYTVNDKAQFNQILLTEIRRLVHASYSMGVEQGIAKQKAFIDSTRE